MKVLSFNGPSNSGKTLTIESLVRYWKEIRLRVGVLKHCPKGYQLDRDGKDSARTFAAGADVVGVAGPDEWAVRTRARGGIDPLELVRRAFPEDLDVVILEGFRDAAVPQVRVLEGTDPLPVGDFPDVLAWVHPTASGGPGTRVFRPGDGRSLGAFLGYRLGVTEAPEGGPACAATARPAVPDSDDWPGFPRWSRRV